LQVHHLMQREGTGGRGAGGEDRNGEALARVRGGPLREEREGREEERVQEPYPKQTRAEHAPPAHTRDGQHGDHQERQVAMSCRSDVARADIERFLQALGQAVQQPGSIYLVGGAELVYALVRPQGAATVDIDLVLAVPDEHAVQMAIRQLITQQSINVVLAGPGDFLPLPANWEAASRYVGRYGPLDVFYLDF